MELSLSDQKAEIKSLLKEAYEVRVKDLNNSFILSEKALDLSRGIGDELLAAKSLSLLALLHMIIGDFDLSINMANEAIDVFEEFKDDKGIADAKYTIAGALYKTDDFHKGLIYLIECLATYRKLDDFHNQARVQKSMGTIYEYFGDLKSAEQTYEEAIITAQMAADKNTESNVYNPLSGIYLNQGKVDKAMQMIESSIQMKNETGDERGLAFALYGRGKVYLRKGKYEKAEKDFLESIKIHDEMGEKLGWAMSHHKLGELYIKMSRLREAKETLVKALEYSNKNRIILIKFKSNLLLHEIAKKEGDFELALKYMTQYIEEKESVINSRTAKIIEDYDTINKMQTLELEATAQKEKAEIIEKKNIELDSFFYRISHDLKSPINSMIGLSYMAKFEVKDPEALKFVEEYDNQANRLNNILDELLKLTKISFNNDSKELVDFDKIINDCIASYKYLENFPAMSFSRSVEKFEFKAEWALINSIIQNLVENGIKYARINNNKPRLDIHVKEENNKVIITAEDNGIGMSEGTKEKVFAMFFRANPEIQGSGLGLHILKRAVEKLNGRIEIQSKLGKGSAFTITLPK